MAEAGVAAPAARQGGKAGAITAVALCFLVATLEGFDIQAAGLAGNNLKAHTGIGDAELGWVLAMANVGLVIGAAFGGWLSDRIGRKPVFLFAVLDFGLFTLATPLAHDYTTLLAVRVLTGLGLGAAMPLMMAIAAEVSRPDRRATTATMMFCGFPFGGAISSIFIANLPSQFDWRALFVVGGIIPLIIAVLILLLMRETAKTAATAEAKHMGPMKALFGEGRAIPTLLIWLAFFPTLMMLYILLGWLPRFSIDKGFTAPLEVMVAGLKVGMNANFTFNLVSIAGALLLGQLADRIGFRWPLIVAYVGLFAGLVMLAEATALPMLLVYAGAAGFFLLGANYALYGVAAAYYPGAVRGAGSGAAVAVGRCGAILGPIVAGELLALKWSANQVIFAMAPLAAIAGVAVLLLSLRKPPASD